MNKSLSIYPAILALLFIQGCASLQKKPGLENSANLRLYIFECGENMVSDVSLFSPGVGEGQKKKLAVSCYLIKHPLGTLLWDSGLADDIAQIPNGMSLKDGKFRLTVNKPLLPQLAEISVTPSDVDYIAFSHFHADHVGNAHAFADSTLLIQATEYEAAFGPEPTQFGYSLKTYENLKHSRLRLLHGDHDVFGDGSVIIKSTPGHTPGHQSLFVRLPKTGPVLLSGDLYHFTDNRIFKRVPIFNFDKEKTLQSMVAMEDFVKKTNAQLWIQHDYEQNQSLHHAPLYYE